MIKLLNNDQDFSDEIGTKEMRVYEYQYVVTSYSQYYFFAEDGKGSINIHGEGAKFNSWIKKQGLRK